MATEVPGLRLHPASLAAPWAADETPETTLVFIGRRLPQQALVQGLLDCVAQGELQAAVGEAAPD